MNNISMPAVITVRASDKARRAVCGLLTAQRWNSISTGNLDSVPDWLRMEVAAARALTQWANHPERDDHTWIASGHWFVRVAKWADTRRSHGARGRILAAHITVDAARAISAATRAGKLNVVARPHDAGVLGAVAVAEAHHRAGRDLASVLAGNTDRDEGDELRIERTRARAADIPAPPEGALRVTADASYHPTRRVGAWAAVISSDQWQTGPLPQTATSSYLAELCAATEALERCPGTTPVELCSDNANVIRVTSQIATGANPQATDGSLEAELIERIAQVCAERIVHARWIPGHAGVAENWLADALAGAALSWDDPHGTDLTHSHLLTAAVGRTTGETDTEPSDTVAASAETKPARKRHRRRTRRAHSRAR